MEPDVDASVLVLHHDDEARLSHVKVLEAAGYVTIATDDPHAALDLIEGSARFKLLIAEIRIPASGPHGIAVANMAMLKRHNLKVIFTTDDPSAIPANFVDRRAIATLKKPLAPEVLLAAVKVALGPTSAL
jgi:DNA-binding NtrC family response regulator